MNFIFPAKVNRVKSMFTLNLINKMTSFWPQTSYEKSQIPKVLNFYNTNFNINVLPLPARIIKLVR